MRSTSTGGSSVLGALLLAAAAGVGGARFFLDGLVLDAPEEDTGWNWSFGRANVG